MLSVVESRNYSARVDEPTTAKSTEHITLFIYDSRKCKHICRARKRLSVTAGGVKEGVTGELLETTDT